jgi:hypothetical protein
MFIHLREFMRIYMNLHESRNIFFLNVYTVSWKKMISFNFVYNDLM